MATCTLVLSTVALNSHLSHGRNPVVWVMSLFLVVAMVAAQESILKNLEAVAYDLMVPAVDQLMVPIVAGVPPSSSLEAEQERQKEGIYIQRLESNPIRLQGSLYVKPAQKYIKQMKISKEGDSGNGLPNFIRYSKEPLPWEGLKPMIKMEVRFFKMTATQL